MNIYTRAALARLLGCSPGDFRPAIAKTRFATQQSPTMHELKTPVDVGERRPAKIVAELPAGLALFPTLASARTAYRLRDQWVPQEVAA